MQYVPMVIGVAGLALGLWAVTRPEVPKWAMVVLTIFAAGGVLYAVTH